MEDDIPYKDVKQGPAGFDSPEGITLVQIAEGNFMLWKNEIFAVRELLDKWIKKYGAFDAYGREIDIHKMGES